MFDDYLKDILSAYEKNKNEGLISSNLSSPTPGSIREECLIVYRERYDKLDDGTLRLFFEFSEKEKSYSRGIDNFKVDGFKQIPKILRGKINNPGIKYIELIAWLTDFKPRPQLSYYHKTVKTPPDPKKPIPGLPLRLQPIIITIIALLLTGASIFFYQKNRKASLNKTGDQKCMYWAGDHYEPTDCDQQISGVTVIPLDIKILNNFKKITLPDTLTKNDLGKIWYTSKFRKPEFFTGSGTHPTDTTRRLKPLSSYILANHVSYYRYIANILIRSFCLLVLAIICAVCLIYFRKKRKKTI